MSEEEKRTLNFVKKYLKDDTGKYRFTNEDLRDLVNLIDNQQKEIEELIEINNKYNDMKYFALTSSKYISKDKIKAKIKELEEHKDKIKRIPSINYEILSNVIQVLQELLGEE